MPADTVSRPSAGLCVEAAEEPWTEKWLCQLHAVISQRSSVVNWLLCGLRTLGTESGGEGFGTGALGRYTVKRVAF